MAAAADSPLRGSTTSRRDSQSPAAPSTVSMRRLILPSLHSLLHDQCAQRRPPRRSASTRRRAILRPHIQEKRARPAFDETQAKPRPPHKLGETRTSGERSHTRWGLAACRWAPALWRREGEKAHEPGRWLTISAASPSCAKAKAEAAGTVEVSGNLWVLRRRFFTIAQRSALHQAPRRKHCEQPCELSGGGLIMHEFLDGAEATWVGLLSAGRLRLSGLADWLRGQQNRLPSGHGGHRMPSRLPEGIGADDPQGGPRQIGIGRADRKRGE